MDDLKYPRKGDVMVVNQMGIFMPNIQHWFTIHSSVLPGWQGVRADAVRGLNSDYVTHSKQGGVQTDVNWTIRPHHGTTSGMAAIMVALCLGYERVVLAGIPAEADRGAAFQGHPGGDTESSTRRYLRERLAENLRGRRGDQESPVGSPAPLTARAPAKQPATVQAIRAEALADDLAGAEAGEGAPDGRPENGAGAAGADFILYGAGLVGLLIAAGRRRMHTVPE